jgi:hypothetical protein
MARVFAARNDYEFPIPPTFDYSKSTEVNYTGESNHFYGDYKDIRQTRDYTYHRNYTRERQNWQDVILKIPYYRSSYYYLINDFHRRI